MEVLMISQAVAEKAERGVIEGCLIENRILHNILKSVP